MFKSILEFEQTAQKNIRTIVQVCESQIELGDPFRDKESVISCRV
jgi:hypothetical protein